MFGWLKKLLKDEGLVEARKPFNEDVEKVAAYLEVLANTFFASNEEELEKVISQHREYLAMTHAKDIYLNKHESMEAYALANMYIREDMGMDPADTSKTFYDLDMLSWEEFKKLDLIQMAKIVNKKEFKPFIDLMEARVHATKMGEEGA
nr:MAG TPA: hypothetical protein [Caudoviricetes sp.]